MGKNVPRLRFKKFIDEWSSTTLNEVAEVNPNAGKLPESFRYIDLGIVQSGGLSETPQFMSKNMAPSRAQRLLMKGDVLYQTVRPYQQNNYLFLTELDCPVVASTGYAQLRVKNSYNKFIYQMLYSPKFVNEVMLRCTGTSYPAINSSELSEINVTIPSLDEQVELGDFLSTIDSRITNQSSKLDSLQELKKGIMQKIFSQEIRFKREDGGEYPDWEYQPLKNCCNYLGDGDWIESKDQSNEGLRIIQTGNVGVGVFKEKEDRARFISLETFGRLKCKEVFPGDILVSRLPEPVGRACIVPESNGMRHVTAVDCTIIKTKKSVIKEYLIQFLSSPNYFIDVAKDIAGSTRVRISRKNLEEVTVSKPSLEEQQKIADFLSTLDSKISLESQILSTLQTLKKGLLQQMFV